MSCGSSPGELSGFPRHPSCTPRYIHVLQTSACHAEPIVKSATRRSKRGSRPQGATHNVRNPPFNGEGLEKAPDPLRLSPRTSHPPSFRAAGVLEALPQTCSREGAPRLFEWRNVNFTKKRKLGSRASTKSALRGLGVEELYVAIPGLGGAVCSDSWARRSCM